MDRFASIPKGRRFLPPDGEGLSTLLPPRPAENPQAQTFRQPGVTRGGTALGRLGDIESHVARVFELHGLWYMLVVTSADGRLTANVCRASSGRIGASVLVLKGTDRERAVRDFLQRNGLQATEPPPSLDAVHPRLPVYVSYDIWPLPSEPLLVASMVTGLFREVAKVSDETDLYFRYKEITKLPST